MPIFGGGRKSKKLRGKKGLKDAFDIQLTPTARDRAAAAKEAAKDAAIRALAREKKREAERQELVDRAEAIKAGARKRIEERQAAAKAAKAARNREPEGKTACTCKKPTLRNGKCTRCKLPPAGRRR